MSSALTGCIKISATSEEKGCVDRPWKDFDQSWVLPGSFTSMPSAAGASNCCEAGKYACPSDDTLLVTTTSSGCAGSFGFVDVSFTVDCSRRTAGKRFAGIVLVVEAARIPWLCHMKCEIPAA